MHVLFMNEYDIDEARIQFGRGDTPNLAAGAEVLHHLRHWTNRNSDGWPYWKKPTQAARKLMALLWTADPYDPQDCTEAELRAALTPIKTFLTKQGADHALIFTPAQP
jgi:hypothetical protein